jgi:hypothetical protein
MVPLEGVGTNEAMTINPSSPKTAVRASHHGSELEACRRPFHRLRLPKVTYFETPNVQPSLFHSSYYTRKPNSRRPFVSTLIYADWHTPAETPEVVLTRHTKQ